MVRVDYLMYQTAGCIWLGRQSWSLSLVGDWESDNRMVSGDGANDSTDDVFYEWDALRRRVARDDGTTESQTMSPVGLENA